MSPYTLCSSTGILWKNIADDRNGDARCLSHSQLSLCASHCRGFICVSSVPVNSLVDSSGCCQGCDVFAVLWPALLSRFEMLVTGS